MSRRDRSPQIGILMLQTQFPRLPGDIGSSESFPCPVIHHVVPNATVDEIVTDQGVNPGLSQQFIEAAQHLESQGVKVIGTSCGFLSVLQSQIQTSVSIPFLSSSLLLLPALVTQYGNNAKLGVLTFDHQKLGAQHIPLSAETVDRQITICGLDKSSTLYQTIAQDQTELDSVAARESVMALLSELLQKSPDVKAIILECTNLSPWKDEMRQRAGVPVFDLVDMLMFFLNGMNNPHVK